MTKMISLELKFFLVSLLWGVILLLLYDVLRILRRFVKHSAFLVSVEDVVFWSISGVLIFVMIYEHNNGTIRGFAIVAIGIGMILYHYLVSEYLIRFICMLLNAILGTLGRILKIIFKPMKMGLHFGNKTAKNISKAATKKLKKTVRTVKITISRK